MRALVAASLVLIFRSQQPAPQQPVFRAGTELVQIDAVVVDKDGRHVFDLTKDDFEILDNGKRQVVVAVNEYRHDRNAAAPLHTDVAANTADRLVVIALDDEHKKDAALDQAKDVAREFIKALAGQAQMALVRTSTEPGVEFTTDAQALLDALDMPPVLIPPAPMRPRADWGSALGILELAPEFSPGRTPRPLPIAPIPYTDFGAVRDGSILANDGRRKVFILISQGSFHQRVESQFLLQDAKDNAKGKLSQARLLDDLSDKLTRILKAAQHSNSAVYIVDPRRSDRELGPPIPSPAPGSLQALLQDAMSVLSASTGGYAAAGDDLATSLDRVMADLNQYYVIGFSPTDRSSTKPHIVDVRVKRPDLVVRSRRQYLQDDRARMQAMAATAKDPLLGLSYSALPSADLPLRAWATTLMPEAGTGTTPIAVWLDSLGTRVDSYGIFIIDMLKNKEVGAPVGRTLTGNVPALLPLEAPLLAPGRYQLRVSAQSRDLNRGGSVYFTLEVPDVSKHALAITSLMLGSGNASRRDLGRLPFEPTLDRTFDAGVTVRMAFELWRNPAADAQARVAFMNAARIVVRTTSETLPASGNGRADIPLSLNGLPPGAYTIVLTIATATHRAEDTIAIVIKP